MKCEEVMELMQRELDRDLNDLEKARMRQHLAECPECAELFARLKRLSDELEQLPRVVPPYSLVDAILPQLDRLAADAAGSQSTVTNGDQADSPAAAPRPLRRPGTAMYIRIAAAAVFGLVIGLWAVNGEFGQWFQRSPSAGEAGSTPSAQQEFTPMLATSGASSGSAPNASDAGDPVAVQKIMKSQAPSAGRSWSGTSGGGAHRSMQDGAANGAPEAAEDPVAKAAGEEGAEGGFAMGFGSETPVHEGFAPDAAEGGSRLGIPMYQSETGAADFTITAQPQEWPSPDGRWIAYVEDGELKVADAAGQKVVFRVSLREGNITGVEWEESGERLRYMWSGPDGNRAEYTVDLTLAGESGGETAP